MSATLHFGFRERWRDFKRGKPGRRFQDRYRTARAPGAKSGTGERILLIVVGLICLIIGVILAVFPGPAVPFFFVAGGLLAAESLVLARLMDWMEVRFRRVLAWAKPRWRRLPTAGRVAVMVFAGCCSMTLMYLSYRILHD